MTTDPTLLALRNAVENASQDPVQDQHLVAILRGHGATGPQRRALFGDVSVQGLLRAAAAHGIDRPTLLAAYAEAKRTDAAANPELDAASKPDW